MTAQVKSGAHCADGRVHYVGQCDEWAALNLTWAYFFIDQGPLLLTTYKRAAGFPAARRDTGLAHCMI